MKRSTLNSIFSSLFLIAIVLLIFLSWNSARTSYESRVVPSPQVETASDLSAVKTQAQKLVAGLENNANLPVTVPTQKLSKENPFSPAE